MIVEPSSLAFELTLDYAMEVRPSYNRAGMSLYFIPIASFFSLLNCRRLRSIIVKTLPDRVRVSTVLVMFSSVSRNTFLEVDELSQKKRYDFIDDKSPNFKDKYIFYGNLILYVSIFRETVSVKRGLLLTHFVSDSPSSGRKAAALCLQVDLYCNSSSSTPLNHRLISGKSSLEVAVLRN